MCQTNQVSRGLVRLKIENMFPETITQEISGTDSSFHKK